MIRPLHDKIVVSRIAEETKTPGGLLIPDVAKEKPVMGKVLAVGIGRVLEDGSVRELDVRVGDTVLFAKFGGNEVELEFGGEKLLILSENDVLGIVES